MDLTISWCGGGEGRASGGIGDKVRRRRSVKNSVRGDHVGWKLTQGFIQHSCIGQDLLIVSLFVKKIRKLDK
jgi:hypothetical protein